MILKKEFVKLQLKKNHHPPLAVYGINTKFKNPFGHCACVCGFIATPHLFHLSSCSFVSKCLCPSFDNATFEFRVKELVKCQSRCKHIVMMPFLLAKSYRFYYNHSFQCEPPLIIAPVNVLLTCSLIRSLKSLFTGNDAFSFQ